MVNVNVNETLPARVDLDEIQSLAQLMIQSKMFSDIQGVAQGAVRILAGRELGIGPVASLRSIEIVRGNLSIRSHLMAAMIKRSARYNYRVTESTEQKCVIEFLEYGEVCGLSEFTIDDARRANLTSNDTWKRYPKTMLYNRAMSQGARMYCPDIFLGGVFYESEIIEAEALPLPIETASAKQLGLLYSLLKDHGVLDGDKRALVDFLYPDGLSKKDASRLIDQIKTDKTLPSAMSQGYIKMWVQTKGADRQEVDAHMDKTYGHHDPAKLNNAQFIVLVEHLAAHGTAETPGDDVYIPVKTVKEVSLNEWVEFTKNICTTCEISATHFEKWVLSQFGHGSTTEMTKLPSEVYHSLAAMDVDSIKKEVTEYDADNTKQPLLVS